MREEYRERSIFENVEVEGSGFSLESMVSSAAQRMIQGALEAEVTEFLGRLPGVKSEAAEGFRGYRNELSRGEAGNDGGWGVDGEAAAGV